MNDSAKDVVSTEYKLGFHDPENYVYKAEKGLSREVVEAISRFKNEPDWMRDFRLRAYEVFMRKPMPEWGADLSVLDFDDIRYYVRPTDRAGRTWEDVPDTIKRTFEKLGIPEAERQYLAGVSTQYESEVVYHNIRKDLAEQGVIFVDTDTAVREHPDLVRQYFATVVPPADNKFAALNSAVWSGGSFIWVPAGVKVEIPLQAYFRINAKNMGQFERTLIVCEPGSFVHYVEGCSAPTYSEDSLHSAVVEIIVKEGARCRYSTIQNWSRNVYNLVTKRAVAYEKATMEWIDGNVGCLTGDTLLYTNPEGVTPIKDIRAGETVYALDPNTFALRKYPVVGLRRTGVRPVYALTVAGRVIKATDNHPFLALERGPGNLVSLRWKPLGELKPGDRIAYAQGLPDDGAPKPIHFRPAYRKNACRLRLPEQTTEALMWLLGFYVGDGYIRRDKKGKGARVYLAAPEQDRSRTRVIEELQGLNLKAILKEKTVVAASLGLADFIESLGFGGNAHQKRVPGWVYRLPMSQKLAFLEGYLDADGCVAKSQGQITFTSCNQALLEDMKLLAVTCGLKVYATRSYRVRRKLLDQCEGEYARHRFCLSKTDLNRVRGHMVTDEGHIAFAPITRIEPLGEDEVFDIEVEGAHNFVANGILVHNSKVTMKYPAVIMRGRGAHAEVVSIAVAGRDMYLDAGAKVIHAAPDTTSRIVSKSISLDGGVTTYRGLVRINPGADRAKASVKCDALIMDGDSKSDTIPYMEVLNDDVSMEHEATVSKVSEEQLFYLMSRGLDEQEATRLIVSGFIEPFTRELPMEYAVELNRLLALEMEGAVG